MLTLLIFVFVMSTAFGDPPSEPCKMEEHRCDYNAALVRFGFEGSIFSRTCFQPESGIALPKFHPATTTFMCCPSSSICAPCVAPQGTSEFFQCFPRDMAIIRKDPCAGVTGYYRQSLCRRHGRPVDIPNLHPAMFLPPFWANDPSYHERYPMGTYKRDAKTLNSTVNLEEEAGP